MKPRFKKKKILLLHCSHDTLGAQNSLGKLCCLCLWGKSCRLSWYYSHAWTVLSAFGLLPRDRKTQTNEKHSLSLQTLCYGPYCLRIEKQRDPKYFCINLFSLKRCFRRLSSPSLAFPTDLILPCLFRLNLPYAAVHVYFTAELCNSNRVKL